MKPKSTVQISVLDVCIPTARKCLLLTPRWITKYTYFSPPFLHTSARRGLRGECIKSCLDVDVQILLSLNN